jgi:hypothetical protein
VVVTQFRGLPMSPSSGPNIHKEYTFFTWGTSQWTADCFGWSNFDWKHVQFGPCLWKPANSKRVRAISRTEDKLVSVHTMTAFSGSTSKAPPIPNFGAKRTLRPLYLPERNLIIHCIGGCVGFRAILEVFVRRKISYPWQDSNPVSSSPYFDRANPAPCPHSTNIL